MRKALLGKPRRTRDDIIKMDVKKTGNQETLFVSGNLVFSVGGLRDGRPPNTQPAYKTRLQLQIRADAATHFRLVRRLRQKFLLKKSRILLRVNYISLSDATANNNAVRTEQGIKMTGVETGSGNKKVREKVTTGLAE